MIFYSLGIYLYGLGIRVASVFYPKAAAWVNGRKHWKQDEKLNQLKDCIWMHCASLGEFEQGRPVLEMLKTHHPERKILLTFFSPSGYEVQKNYPFADYVTYLPLDTPQNAKNWIQQVQPALVIFVKYDLWANFLLTIHRKKIPLFLISATFRPNQWLFRPFNLGLKKVLHCFTHIFTQDEYSAELLKLNHITNVTVAGDTRIDRVIALRNIEFKDARIEQFIQHNPVLIAGSTWEPDEQLLAEAMHQLPPDYRFILVPHDISEPHVRNLERLIPFVSARYTDPEISGSTRVLIVNKIGILNKLYRYATWTYVGGGFGKSVHNLLEPTVYNKPVFFGPNHTKFPEAQWLIEAGLGHVVKTSSELVTCIQSLPTTNNSDIPLCILQRSGGTSLVVHYLSRFLNSLD